MLKSDGRRNGSTSCGGSTNAGPEDCKDDDVSASTIPALHGPTRPGSTCRKFQQSCCIPSHRSCPISGHGGVGGLELDRQVGPPSRWPDGLKWIMRLKLKEATFGLKMKEAYILILYLALWPQPLLLDAKIYRASATIKLPDFGPMFTEPVASTTERTKNPSLEAPKNQKAEPLLYSWDKWQGSEGPLLPPVRDRREANRLLRQPSSQFHCYDIENKENLIERFSLTDMPKCETRSDRYENAVPAEIMILHMNHESSIIADSCRLTISKRYESHHQIISMYN